MTGTWFCTDCKTDIPDEAPNCDRSQRKPCPICGSLERTQLVFGTDSATASEGVMLSVSAADRAVFHDTTAVLIDSLESLPTLVTQSLIIPENETSEGILIRETSIPWRKILKLLLQDPSLMYQFDSRKWEEIIAGTYKEAGWDEVILTPPSGDLGRDVIATKHGIGSVRFIESVKRYKPGHLVTAKEVRELGFVLGADQNATKGIVSTTSDFAPRIEEDPLIKPYLPHRIELLNGPKLIQRFIEWTGADAGGI